MTKPAQTLQADVIVVGSGPGGATVARELSRKGKKVIICEAGKYNNRFGYSVYLLGMMDGLGLTFSMEGTWVLRPKTVGGASVVYLGTAVRPPAWLKDKYGIDLREEVDELYKEIPIQKLPDSLVGPGARKIMRAAQDIGLDWNQLDKWIRPEKCKPNCGGCAVGCKTGAKWTAREFVDEACRNGAQLLMRTKVDHVLTESGKATGVRAKGPKGWVDIHADTVILAAGGQGTPPILQRSGIHDAGQGFFADPVYTVTGPTSSKGCLDEVPMTAGTIMVEDGIVMTDLMTPPLFYAGTLGLKGPKGWVDLPKVLRAKSSLGIMVKVRDGLEGRVNHDETFSKPIDFDTQWKLSKGVVLAEQILQKAGVKRDDIVQSCLLAAHPGGTVRIGELLDKDCQTQIRGCYCMDTSIIPEPWGLPPTVTVVAMAKRLAKHLLVPVAAQAAQREHA
ncbi:MAG: FAD-dependent oxidoreductase [bacterium]